MRAVTGAPEIKRDPACADVIHPANESDPALIEHFCQGRAALADLLHHQLDVGLRDLLHELLVGGIARPAVGGDVRDCRFDPCDETAEAAWIDTIDRALDRAAIGVAHHCDEFRPGGTAGKFQAAEDVITQDVAGDARAENVPDALVENQLGRLARIDTAQDDREGKLPGCGGFYLRTEISRKGFP